MKKLFKILAWTLGGLITLVVVAAVVLVLTFDPNKYKPEIARAVKDATGRDLVIDGDLKLSIFPWLGIETGKLTFSNAQGFGPQPMARVQSAAVKVAVLPLLRKVVVVDAIRLNGLELHLARAANGSANWDDLTKAPATTPQKPTPEKSNGGAPVSVAVNKIEVLKSQFTWVDRAAGTSYSFKNVDANSGNLLGSAPAPLHIAFDFESGKPKVTRRVSLDGRLNLNPSDESLNVPELRLALGDLRLQAQLTGTNIMRAPAVKGRVEVPAFNLRALLQDLNLAYAPADDKALASVALGTQFDYGPQAIALSNLKFTLDDSTLSGKLSIQQKPRTAYQAELAIDSLDIDRYLPKAAPDNKDAPAKTSESADKGSVAIPIALLRETEADARLQIQKLKAFGIRSQQAVIKISAHNGKVTIGPNQAKLYDGTYAGTTVIDATGKTPKYRFEEKLANVQLGPFLKDAGAFNYFSGGANVGVTLTAQGLDATDIKKTLNGNVSVAVKDGAIEGIDLVKMEAKVKEVRQREGGSLRNIVGALPELQPAKGDQTKFTKLGGSATVANGVVTNKDLAVEAPRLRVNGSGVINLVTDTYENYVLKVNDLPPIIVSGKLAQPKFRPDWNTAVKEQAQKAIQPKVDELKNKLLDKLRRR